MALNPYSTPRRKYLPIAITAVVAGLVGYSISALFSTDTSIVYVDTDSAEISQPLSEAIQLADQGQLDQAQQNIDSLLADRPDNFSAQLLAADVQLRQGDLSLAEQSFERLHKAFPERPEPLNNLAAIYAQRNDYSKAASYLQKALDTHSNYRLIYQNLKDLHAAQAAQAYSKALGLTSDTPPPKLVSLNSLGSLAAPLSTQSINTETLIAINTQAEAPVEESIVTTEASTRPAPDSQVISTEGNRVVVSLPLIVNDEPNVTSPQIEPEPIENIIETTPPQLELSGNDEDFDLEALDQRLVANTDSPTLENQSTTQYTNIVIDPNDSRTIQALQHAGSDVEGNTRFDEFSVNAQLEATDRALAVTSEQVEAETARAEALLAALEQEVNSNNAPVIQDTQPTLSFEQQVEDRLRKWANAWQGQNVAAYIASYVAGYQPSVDVSHEAWKDLRNTRITRPSFIEIGLDQIEITRISDTEAEITFVQDYRADHYQDSERKRLRLMLRSSGWKIISEAKAN